MSYNFVADIMGLSSFV